MSTLEANVVGVAHEIELGAYVGTVPLDASEDVVALERELWAKLAEVAAAELPLELAASAVALLVTTLAATIGEVAHENLLL